MSSVTPHHAPSIESVADLKATGLDDEIIKVLADPDTARALLLRAGYPREWLPSGKSAAQFLPDVFAEIESGRTTLSFAALLRTLAQAYSGNPRLRPYAALDLKGPESGVRSPDGDEAPATTGIATATSLESPKDAQEWTRFDLFLSYNSRDAGLVEPIAHALVERGLHPWLDRWHLGAGAVIDSVIGAVLRDVHAVAVFVSPKGFGPWQSMEVRHAIQRFTQERQERPLIPVILPGGKRHIKDLPLGLSGRSWVEFADIGDRQGLDRLVRAVKPTS